jgi:hypothetical protein
MKSQAEHTLNNTYGVGVVSAPAYSVYWALDAIQDIEQAKKELKWINDLRKRHGVIPVTFPYGHRLF